MDNPIVVSLGTCCIVLLLTVVHLVRVHNRANKIIESMLNHMVKHLEREMERICKKKEIEGGDLIYQTFELQKVFRDVSFDYGITMGGNRRWYVVITIGHHTKLAQGPIYKVK